MPEFRNKSRKWLLIVCFIFLMGCSFRMDAYAADAKQEPYVTEAKLISNQDIELYWSEAVTGADAMAAFSITVDGVNNPIYYYTWEEYNYTEKGIVYYSPRSLEYPDNPDTPKTSIRLSKPISDLTNLPEINVKIAGNSIKNNKGSYVSEQTVTVSKYDAFYQQEVILDCGVKILGTAKVRPEAMTKAKEMLEIVLANEKVAKRMGDAGCMLGIFGEGEIAYDILEHRYSYEEAYLYVEGFGGTQLASIKDANVLRLREADYWTNYSDESILVHEFGHTVQNFGLSDAQQGEWESIFYNSVTKGGKWANSYAGSNSSEYFATLSAIWFNAMNDTEDGQWDGVRGPINTREELKVYDNAAYTFLSKIYVSDQYLPAPWENGSVPDNYTWSDGSQSGDNTQTGDESQTGGGSQTGDEGQTGDNAQTGDNIQTGNNNLPTDTVQQETNNTKPVDNTQPVIVKTKITVGKASFSSIKAVKGKKVSITLKKVSGAAGYKIIYAKDSKFKKSVKTKYTKSRKLTIKNLKKGTYYFKVQAYKLNPEKKKVYGKAGTVKKVIVKK